MPESEAKLIQTVLVDESVLDWLSKYSHYEHFISTVYDYVRCEIEEIA